MHIPTVSDDDEPRFGSETATCLPVWLELQRMAWWPFILAIGIPALIVGSATQTVYFGLLTVAVLWLLTASIVLRRLTKRHPGATMSGYLRWHGRLTKEDRRQMKLAFAIEQRAKMDRPL